MGIMYFGYCKWGWWFDWFYVLFVVLDFFVFKWWDFFWYWYKEVFDRNMKNIERSENLCVRWILVLMEFMFINIIYVLFFILILRLLVLFCV